mmetsp:Transcript_51391/g.109831  ORF Transcript_51391/g.109831 Transcript_51391/m.109831 type:complete len:272 (+) Transcript_51391:592-1407(+)
MLRPFRPIVADCVGVDRAVAVERAARDRRVRLAKALEALPIILIPEGVHPIAPGGGERAKRRVEGDAVDREDVVVLAMTFEGEVKLLVLLPGAHMVDRDTPFDGAEAEASPIGPAGDAAALVLEGRGDGRVRLGGVVQIDNHHLAVGSGRHQQLATHIGCVRALRQLQRRTGRWTLPIPELDGLVPGARDEEVLLRDPEDVLDGRVMRGNLHRLVGGQIPHLGRLIAAPRVHACAILGPASAKYGRGVRDGCLRDTRPVALHFPAADLIVP